MAVIHILFGATAPRLAAQVKLRAKEARHLQALADSIVRLAIHGILSESQTHAARRKVMKLILKAATDAR